MDDPELFLWRKYSTVCFHSSAFIKGYELKCLRHVIIAYVCCWHIRQSILDLKGVPRIRGRCHDVGGAGVGIHGNGTYRCPRPGASRGKSTEGKQWKLEVAVWIRKVNMSHRGTSLGLGYTHTQGENARSGRAQVLTVVEKQIPFKKVVVVIVFYGKNPFT